MANDLVMLTLHMESSVFSKGFDLSELFILLNLFGFHEFLKDLKVILASEKKTQRHTTCRLCENLFVASPKSRSQGC